MITVRRYRCHGQCGERGCSGWAPGWPRSSCLPRLPTPWPSDSSSLPLHPCLTVTPSLLPSLSFISPFPTGLSHSPEAGMGIRRWVDSERGLNHQEARAGRGEGLEGPGRAPRWLPALLPAPRGPFLLPAAIPTWEAAEGTPRPVTDLKKHGGHSGRERKTSDIFPPAGSTSPGRTTHLSRANLIGSYISLRLKKIIIKINGEMSWL